MVENSLGRLWMTLHPESSLISEMPYYIATPEGQTDVIPEDIHSAKDILFLDPCVGSGHILVYAFDLFCKMYEEEGEQTKDIPALILENNLYGIDIDRRCYQLASFALTMKARAYYRRYLRHTVSPNVLALQPIDHDTIASTGAWPSKSLMWQFEHIDTIGSLLKITPEECTAIQVESGLFGERQRLLKKQAEYLSRGYHCVVTNPPYLGKGIGDKLKDFMHLVYPNSESDTMAAFMERSLDYSMVKGKISMINMHSWMFNTIYKKLRFFILENVQIDNMIHLGTRAFEEIGGEVVQSTSFVLAKHSPSVADYFRLVDGVNSKDKEEMFLNRDNRYSNIHQSNFSQLPGCPIAYRISNAIACKFKNNKTIKEVCRPSKGMMPGSSFLLYIWEVNHCNIEVSVKTHQESLLSNKKWYLYYKGGPLRRWYGNLEFIVNYLHDGNNGANLGDRNPSIYFKDNIHWSKISSGKFSARKGMVGALYDDAACQCMVYNSKDYYYILALLNSPFTQTVLRLLNETMNYSPGEVAKIPYICKNDYIGFINTLVEDNIAISKQDWDSHETSWDFQRNPLWEQQLVTILFEMQEQGIMSEDATIDDIGPFNLPDLLQPLEILVENYESEWEDLFHQLHRNEEELNRKFIEIYGLQEELTPDVPLDE